MGFLEKKKILSVWFIHAVWLTKGASKTLWLYGASLSVFFQMNLANSHLQNNSEMFKTVANIWESIKVPHFTKFSLRASQNTICICFLFFFWLKYLLYSLKDASIQVKEWWIYTDNNSLNILELEKCFFSHNISQEQNINYSLSE